MKEGVGRLVWACERDAKRPMKHPNSILVQLETILADPARGVVGLVDEILMISRFHDIKFTWQNGFVSATVLEETGRSSMTVPMPRSVFRAALARIAALSNEHVPNSVSPYGGKGDISIRTGSIGVTFSNTKDELSLELAPIILAASFPMTHSQSSD